MVPDSVAELERLWRSDDPKPREALIYGIARAPRFDADGDFADSDELLRKLASFLTVTEAVALRYELADGVARVPEHLWRDRFLSYFPESRQPLRVGDFLWAADDWIDEGWYPSLGSDNCYEWCAVGIRLHAFASSKDWAVAFERNVWSHAMLTYTSVLDVFYSNGVDGCKLDDLDKPLRSPIGSKSRLWSDDGFTLNPLSFELPINGVPRKFSFKRSDYKRINAALSPDDEDCGYDDEENLAVKTLRLLDVTLGDEIYMKPDEILATRLADDPELRHLFTLSDFYLPPTSTMPSETKTFRMIGEALVYQDPSRYRPADAESPNTRWSDWPFASDL